MEERETIVINLYGGSGIGKSTIAALLFAQMKMLRMNVELVREYVKLWAWTGKKVRPADQIYLLGKQSAYESLLYGKVDYIVTDSPVMLAGAYAEWHSGEAGRYVTNAARGYYDVSRSDHGVKHLNYVLARGAYFDTCGRYETREEAEQFDEFLKEYLVRTVGAFPIIHGTEQEKVNSILLDLHQYISNDQEKGQIKTALGVEDMGTGAGREGV